ncbi:MAG: hypothetical protein J6P37_05660 [Lachnospiraceae bacterium]|nr:hypothetical protein [Lachnospiraceae bacterium]
MNKDLSKEYKEAVMNDLPDLWGRIEAAIDEEERKNGNETESSNVINFSKPEENKVNTANKYAVNVYDNEPVNKAQTNKKKFRIPAWVFVAVPSAAILLLVIIPVGLLMMMSGMDNKSATTTAWNKSAPTSAATTTNSESEIISFDAAATWDEPAMEDADYAYERDIKEYALTEEYEITTEADSSESAVEQNAEFTINPGDIDGKNGMSFITTPSTKNEEIEIINEKVKVKILSVYENDEGTLLADVEIVEILADYDYIPDDFEGFEEGKILTAYMMPYFRDIVLNEQEYDCSIKYIPDDEIGYVIEPVIRD